MFDSGDFADFTLFVGQRSFRCHKNILSARSPFFQAMFRDRANQESVKGEVCSFSLHLPVVFSVLRSVLSNFVLVHRIVAETGGREPVLTGSEI